MLMRTDPFRELDRITQAIASAPGTWSRPAVMPMDAYRDGDEFVAYFDIPGVPADSIELSVERNVLTVKAERRPMTAGVELQAAERPLGVFSRQLFLSDALDTEHMTASYDLGVLTLRIPVAQKAKPRRIAVTEATTGSQSVSATSAPEAKQIDA